MDKNFIIHRQVKDVAVVSLPDNLSEFVVVGTKAEPIFLADKVKWMYAIYDTFTALEPAIEVMNEIQSEFDANPVITH